MRYGFAASSFFHGVDWRRQMFFPAHDRSAGDRVTIYPAVFHWHLPVLYPLLPIRFVFLHLVRSYIKGGSEYPGAQRALCTTKGLPAFLVTSKKACTVQTDLPDTICKRIWVFYMGTCIDISNGTIRQYYFSLLTWQYIYRCPLYRRVDRLIVLKKPVGNQTDPCKHGCRSNPFSPPGFSGRLAKYIPAFL